MKWTGLTGGIATGKSTAAKLIESLGVPVIDADLISHRLSQIGELGYEKILSQFGKEILNSDLSINRKKLGEMVFSDQQKKSRLENILHPLIRDEVQEARERYEKQGVSLCFYDVPLLFEKNLMSEFDQTVLIWCDKETQLQRLMKRSGLTIEEAVMRIENQLPMIDKVKMADYCIDNSGDAEDLEKQMRKLLTRLSGGK